MFGQLRRCFLVVVLGLASVGVATPASAGMPVIDSANLAQADSGGALLGTTVGGDGSTVHRARAELRAVAKHLPIP